MRKIITATLMLAALALGGCATSGTLPSTGTTAPPTSTGNATVDAVQSAVVKACGFLPTATTVSGILSTFVPGAAPVTAIVSQIATSICAAVAPPRASARRKASSGPPTVRGVTVEGRFVR